MQGAPETGTETFQPPFLGAVDPPLPGLGNASRSALIQCPGQHQRLIETGQQVAPHQCQIAQHIGRGHPGGVNKAGALINQIEVDPGRAPFHTFDKQPQRFRAIRDGRQPLGNGGFKQRP